MALDSALNCGPRDFSLVHGGRIHNVRARGGHDYVPLVFASGLWQNGQLLDGHAEQVIRSKLKPFSQQIVNADPLLTLFYCTIFQEKTASETS